MAERALSYGICLGASTVSMVCVERHEGAVTVCKVTRRAHEGRPRDVLRDLLGGEEFRKPVPIAVTGRRLKERLALPTLSEPEAVEEACRFVLPEGHPFRIVLSAGGETTMVYHLSAEGLVESVHSGNKCASGTGEFLVQQLSRMGLTVEEAGRMASVKEAYPVSGRCAVFCKSDCTHAMNKGVPRSRVVGGLAAMMAGKMLDLVRQVPPSPVLFVGGCAATRAIVDILRARLPELLVPDEAPWFEALGAALWAGRQQATTVSPSCISPGSATASRSLAALADHQAMVRYLPSARGKAMPGDLAVVGLDVGSTTTKGVVVRRGDFAVLASEYLRTDGDPIAAARRVYASLAQQMPVDVVVEGLGITGSGRRIAGLHGLTDGVVNEIIAHAAAAAHYEAGVDTIFEIGGQDAKYTHLANGVPIDYAMNEACSAGTGSFLEEAACESLGLALEQIGPTAMQATVPSDFSGQCAAFIGSDIAMAAQAGVPREDIVAGLVYSVAKNYIERVKGDRPVGATIFVQGGVCYNEAVPVALAGLTGQRVVVPPDPGLMGALGVALVVDRRLAQALMTSRQIDLTELAQREVGYDEPFTCPGGKEKCDRGCRIERIRVQDCVYPFGGICNRFDSVMTGEGPEGDRGRDLVRYRQEKVLESLDRGSFPGRSGGDGWDCRPTIGMNRSLLTHTWFPFFNRFFAELGFRVMLPDRLDEDGMGRCRAAFCFPVEIAHGFAADLLRRDPDFFFLPHIAGLPPARQGKTSCTCVLSQGEPFYLRVAFPAFTEERTLSPTLDFSKGIDSQRSALADMARRLHVDPRRVDAAMKSGAEAQEDFFATIRRMGDEELAALENRPEVPAVVLFGKPYNAFASEANKGIPSKFASRGISVIPFDMLLGRGEARREMKNMYWSSGQQNLEVAELVRDHPRLFGVFLTNFSCGPDSFVITYFRNMMGQKPSLTLEVDGHTADAGIETRIEAFLDIVRQWRPTGMTDAPVSCSRSAHIELRKGQAGMIGCDGAWHDLRDSRVKVVLPAMGRYTGSMLASAFSRVGVRAEALPPADEAALKLGRANSLCKECLPLQTTVGSLLAYLGARPQGEMTAFFMPKAEGPCRFGQYHVFTQQLIEKHGIRDAAVLSLTSLDGYGGLGPRFTLAAWRAIALSDVLYEIRSALLALAKDPRAATTQLDREAEALAASAGGMGPRFFAKLTGVARRLRAIPLARSYRSSPKISLVGEIYVRHDPLSLQGLVETLAGHGFVVRTSPISEWLNYCDWAVAQDSRRNGGLSFKALAFAKGTVEAVIRGILSGSRLTHPLLRADPGNAIKVGGQYVSPKLKGEAVLTVGAALDEVVDFSCGVVAIGPFGCLPGRVAESVLSEKFTIGEKRRARQHVGENEGALALARSDRKLPLLIIETDGNPFPQLIEARLESFILQARRMHEEMLGAGVFPGR